MRTSTALFFLWLGCTLFCTTPSHARKRARKVIIHLYPGYCQPLRCQIKGRVLAHVRSIDQPNVKKGRFGTMFSMIRRFTRKHIAFTGVLLRFQGKEKLVVTGKKGYFKGEFLLTPKTTPTSQKTTPTSQKTTTPQRTASSGWPPWTSTPTPFGLRDSIQPVHARLAWPKKHKLLPAHAQSFMLQSSTAPGLSLISDIDDTLIKTFVTKKTKMVRKLLFSKTEQIPVFPHALDFLRGVLKVTPQTARKSASTLHYVSGSPYQLSDRMIRLFRLHHFPLGSLNMKKISGKQKYSLFKQISYKVESIRPIFQAYPKHRFVLLGDSGEKDPEIYAQIRKEFPGRVAGIYIHNVSKASTKHPRFKGMFLFTHYVDALAHFEKSKRQR